MSFRDAIEKRYGSESSAVTKCATYIACVSFDIGSAKSEFVLEGVEEAGQTKGNWKITVERLPD